MTLDGTNSLLSGPLVRGKPTSVSVISSRDISTSRFLPGIIGVINAAFSESHYRNAQLGMNGNFPRIASDEEFLRNITHDTEAFAVAIHPKDEKEVFATATARRYSGPSSDPTARITPWVRRLEVEDGFEEWELKMMATNPDLQGQGLAGYMMKFVDDEVIRRFSKKQLTNAASHGDLAKRLKIPLSTPTEVNGSFYLRKGYKVDYENERGEGYNFHIAFMSKEIIIPALNEAPL
ncbi:hypothetical protein HII31_00445 [Pseudocercospora fuligena]|uniref:N-acetyltransferase domain-containing protein n=1 Tax=Pseudocercospora fuligena TaxID=685502 RepID=A0A8H6VRP7_9PEZI|nr:hypothetical protein HII31_00445 [Pseudocercospora fuligena]